MSEVAASSLGITIGCINVEHKRGYAEFVFREDQVEFINGDNGEYYIAKISLDELADIKDWLNKLV